MLNRSKQLIGKSVRTQSGQELGVVTDMEIDTDQQTVVGYYVKKSKLLPEFITGELVVRPKQIISITATAIIVEDLVIPSAAAQTAIGSV